MLRRELVTKLCLDEEALQQAFRLRYASYLDKAFIAPSDDKLFFDIYDTLPNCVTFGVYDSGEMVASIRACVYAPLRGWNDIPVAQRFGEAFIRWVAVRNVTIEWNRFVICPQYRSDPTAVEIALLSSVPFIAGFFQSVSFMAAVRERHVKFYRRFGYDCIAEPVQYFGVSFFAKLMAMDWDPHRERLQRDRIFSRCWQYIPSLEHLDPRSRRNFESRFLES